MSKQTRKELEHSLRFWSEEAREKEIAKRLGDSNNSLLDQFKQAEGKPEADDSLAMIAEKSKRDAKSVAELGIAIKKKKAAKAAKAKATRAANKAKKEANPEEGAK